MNIYVYEVDHNTYLVSDIILCLPEIKDILREDITISTIKQLDFEQSLDVIRNKSYYIYHS